MKTLLIAFLIVSGAAHAQYEQAAGTLERHGWFDSHHKAATFGPRNNNAGQADRDAVNAYARAMEAQAQSNQRRNDRRECYQTNYGIICQ